MADFSTRSIHLNLLHANCVEKPQNGFSAVLGHLCSSNESIRFIGTSKYPANSNIVDKTAKEYFPWIGEVFLEQGSSSCRKNDLS